MSLAHACALIENDRRQEVKVDTWGHLAPQKGVKYPIEFVAVVGYFSENILNPVLLSCGPENGPWYSPWFYDSVNGFLSDRIGKNENEGKIFRFTGHWRNYKFVGKFRRARLEAA